VRDRLAGRPVAAVRHELPECIGRCLAALLATPSSDVFEVRDSETEVVLRLLVVDPFDDFLQLVAGLVGCLGGPLGSTGPRQVGMDGLAFVPARVSVNAAPAIPTLSKRRTTVIASADERSVESGRRRPVRASVI
jgi:hypothetical protein